MKKTALALVAAITGVFSSCSGKTEADFSIVPVKGSGGNYQYIDIAKKGKIVISPKFRRANIFRDGLALVETDNGKYGYIDKKGEFAITPVYDVAQNFNEGMAWVQMEDQPPMLIDKKGQVLLQIDSLTAAMPYYEGIANVGYYTNGQEYFMHIDKKGRPVTTIVDGEQIGFIAEGIYAYGNAGTRKWGYKNKKGDVVVKEQFDNIRPFHDGMAVVESDGKWGVINKKGEYLINPQYDDLRYDSDGLFRAKIDKKYGWINNKGENVINPQYDGALFFNGNKLAPVQVENKWAYIDRKGQIAIEPQFETALPFNGKYAMVLNNKAGFINSKGEFAVPPLYSSNADNVFEYLLAGEQNTLGIPARRDKNIKFNSYKQLKEKQKAWRAAQADTTRQTKAKVTAE